MFGDDRHVCSWYWTHNVVYICPYGKSPVWGRFCAWNQPLPPHPRSLDLSALKRKTHAEFALFWVARKMSLGKVGWGVKLLRVARVTLQWSVWLIMSRVRTVRGESVAFSHRIFCVTVLCFVFYKTCLSSWWSQSCGNCLNRAGQASLEIWLRYSSVACFLPDAGAILPYLEQLWQSGTVLWHTILLLKEMQLDLNFLPQTCQAFVIVCHFLDPFPVIFWSYCMTGFSWPVAFYLL